MTTRNAVLACWILILVAGLYGIAVYPQLPERIPCHWNWRGEVDGWMLRDQAVIFGPGIMLIGLLGIWGLPRISPKPFSMENFRATFNLVMVEVVGLFAFIHVLSLRAAMHPEMDSGRIVIGGIMIFFALLSNVMGRVRRNLWMGIRTPWTLASDRVWIATHRFAARLWTVVSLVCAAMAFLGAPLGLVLAVFIIAIFIPIIYSYQIHRNGGTDDGGNTAALFLIGIVTLAMATPTQAAGKAQEVTFTGEGGLTMRGTLLVPEGAAGKKYPAVLLLPGSGPPDRDGNVRPVLITDLLKQIAERLAAQGVASLRYDKRSVATYAKDWPKDVAKVNAFFDWDKFVGDAAAGYRFLRQRPEVNSARVGIVGHSEGGLIALQLGKNLTQSKEAPKTLVLLATGGRTLDVVIREQLAYVLPQQLPDKEQVNTYLDAADRAIAQVKKNLTLPTDMPAGLASLFNPTITRLLYAYFTIDPAPLATAFPGPVLVAQGNKDTQISAERDAPRLIKALQQRKGDKSELLIIPDAGHLLQDPTAKPANLPKVAPTLLDKLAAWLPSTLNGS